MKKAFLILIFSLIFIFSAKNQIKAQNPGTFSCRWNSVKNSCEFATINCSQGYEPRVNCDSPIPSQQSCSIFFEPAPCREIENDPQDGGAGGGRGGGTSDDQNIFCDDNLSINTALGCINVSSFNDLAGFFLSWSFGVAGGLALMLIFFGGFQIITAGPDPKKAQAGKEIVTAAVGGLLFLLFSIFLLRLIGIQIFQIPGLN